jgi:hypothetical protein
MAALLFFHLSGRLLEFQLKTQFSQGNLLFKFLTLLLENDMNRRTFLRAVPALGVLGVTNLSFSKDANDTSAVVDVNKPIAPIGEPIKLNTPELDKGVSLMQALKKRKSGRSYSDKKLTQQQLSDMLWAADGVNRPDKKRTSPAAMGIYNTDIYVVLAEGIYLYGPVKM